MMEKGGTMDNLRIAPEHAKEVQAACESIVSDDLSAIVDSIQTSLEKKRGRRLVDYKWREELCEGLLNACPREDESDDDDKDDDDDDDREL